MEKNGSQFSHLLTVRAEVADPPIPPYSQPDRKISAFFDAFPNNLWHEKVMLKELAHCLTVSMKAMWTGVSVYILTHICVSIWMCMFV